MYRTITVQLVINIYIIIFLYKLYILIFCV